MCSEFAEIVYHGHDFIVCELTLVVHLNFLILGRVLVLEVVSLHHQLKKVHVVLEIAKRYVNILNLSLYL